MESYILAYIIRNHKGDKYKDMDKYEVFCEDSDVLGTTKEQVERRLEGLLESSTENKEVYSWNVCKIIKTSEHYPV